MSKLFKLIKINLLTIFDIHKFINAKGFKEKKKAIPMLLLYLYAFGILAFFVYRGASFTLDGLIQFDQPHILLVMMMVVSSIYTIFTTIFKVNKTVFDAKDYSILLGLPIKKSIIITSKVALLYITNLIFTALFMIPTYLTYIMKVDVNLIFHLNFLITFLLIPIIPTIIGTIIGSFLTSIGSRFKYKNFANILISLGFIIGVYYFSYQIQSLNSIDLANLSNSIVNHFNSIYPLTKVYLNIIKNNSMIDLILFILTSIALYQIFIYILVKYFEKINSRLNEVTITSKYDEEKLNVNSQLKSLYKKEIKRYFSSALYVLNTAVGCLMLLFALGALLIFDSETVDAILQIPELTNYFVLFGPLVFGVFCSLSCTTNSSISLEGKNLWILKSLPVDIKYIFIAKIMVNLTILLPTIFIGSIMLTFIANLTIVDFLLLLFTPTMFALFISGFGLLINLYFPDFNWINEIKPIKQSVAVLVSLAVGMTISIAPLMIDTSIDSDLYSLLIGFIVMIITIVTYLILFNHGKKIFKNL